MRYVQVESDWWLVVDEALQPRYLIHHGPAVNRATHETHIMYRVIRWQLEKNRRESLYWCETFAEAQAWITQAAADAAVTSARVQASVDIMRQDPPRPSSRMRG